MNVAERFIRRPVVTILMMLGILLLGVTGYLFLPAFRPRNLDSPTILVSANLPGGSAAIMESSVATPLERQFVTLTGLDRNSPRPSSYDERIVAFLKQTLPPTWRTP